MASARERVVADFEEGVNGDPIAPDAAGKPPLEPGDLTYEGATYTSDSHGGSLAARVLQTVTPSTDRLVLFTEPVGIAGGAGWFKVIAATADNAVAQADLMGEGSTTQYGVVINITSGGNVQAVEYPAGDTLTGGAFPFDTWLRLELQPGGVWALSSAGGTILSGTAPAPPTKAEKLTWAIYAPEIDDEVLVDDISIYLTTRPVVRMYPRDDGRGMSSAPRIHPQPRGRSRIIGGFQ